MKPEAESDIRIEDVEAQEVKGTSFGEILTGSLLGIATLAIIVGFGVLVFYLAVGATMIGLLLGSK